MATDICKMIFLLYTNLPFLTEGFFVARWYTFVITISIVNKYIFHENYQESFYRSARVYTSFG
jgi:hypothetical protein